METLRREGMIVVQELPGQSGDARAMGCTHALKRFDTGWQATALGG